MAVTDPYNTKGVQKYDRHLTNKKWSSLGFEHFPVNITNVYKRLVNL